MALGLVRATERLAARSGHDLSVRVGILTGASVAGVIGTRTFIYDVWGDAVNRASRMESHGVPRTRPGHGANLTRLRGSFAFERRGAIAVKGLGRMTTYFLGAPFA